MSQRRNVYHVLVTRTWSCSFNLSRGRSTLGPFPWQKALHTASALSKIPGVKKAEVVVICQVFAGPGTVARLARKPQDVRTLAEKARDNVSL